MAKQKVKVPKRIGGIKIKKRQRRQLRALVRQVDRLENLVATGTALVTMLGLASHKLKKKDDQASAMAH